MANPLQQATQRNYVEAATRRQEESGNGGSLLSQTLVDTFKEITTHLALYTGLVVYVTVCAQVRKWNVAYTNIVIVSSCPLSLESECRGHA